MSAEELAGALRLEVEQTPTGLQNMVVNPSGDLGGWGWVTPVAGSTMRSGVPGTYAYLGQSLVYRAGTGANYFTTENMPVAAGQYVSASFRLLYTGNYTRVKIEWLDAAGALLSSTTQSGYLNAVVNFPSTFYGPFLAPASTAYCRLRFDHYNTTGGANPAAGHELVLKEVTVAKAATSGALGGLRINLVPNPNFETNTTGWQIGNTRTSIARTTAVGGFGGSAALSVTRVNGASSQTDTGPITTFPKGQITVAPDRRFIASAYFRAATVARQCRMDVYFYDAAGARIQTIKQPVPTMDAVGSWTRSRLWLFPPSNAVYAAVCPVIMGMATSEVHYVDAVMLEESQDTGTPGPYFDGATTDAGGIDYAWSGTANNSYSTATAASQLPFIEPVSYRDILGPTHDIQVTREELNVGTLTARVLDSTLDPSQADLIRPGKRVRLSALNADTEEYEPLFTGKINTANVSYDRDSLIYPEVSNTQTNLIPNPSFEVGLANYDNPVNCAIARITSDHHEGIACVEQTATAGGYALAYFYEGVPDIHQGVTGDTFTVSFWYKGLASTAAQMIVQTYDSIGGPTGNQYLTFDPVIGGVWQRATVTFTLAGAGTTQFYLIPVAYMATAGDKLLWDEFILQEGAFANQPYFDGSHTSDESYIYAWTGTAHNSTSTRTINVISTLKKTQITLTAVDAASTLANTSRAEGVATIADLPYVLEGAGVPWVCDGYSGQISSATVVSKNDAASALDQVAITRDSTQASAWVDPQGVLVVNPFGVTQRDVLMSTQGFESASVPAGWTALNGTLTTSTTVAQTGTRSLRIATTANGNTQAYTPPQPVIPGFEYTVSAGVRCGTTSRACEISIHFLDDNNTPMGSFGMAGVAASTTAFTPLTLSAVAPPGATKFTCNLLAAAAVAGQFIYWDNFNVTGPGWTTIDESVYSDVDVDFSTERTINEVRVRWLRYNATSQETEEIVYGPFRDEDSIAEWGIYAAEFTMQGANEDIVPITLFALDVLSKNKTPKVRVNAATIPIKTLSDLTRDKAFIDLYDSTLVNLAIKDISEYSRVTSLSHSITPDRWMLNVSFAESGTVATPQATPSVTNGQSNVTSRSQAGIESVSFSSATSHTRVITFDTPFTVAPSVVTNIASGGGSQSYWVSRAISVNASQFTLFVFAGDANADIWASVPVMWQAMVPS